LNEAAVRAAFAAQAKWNARLGSPFMAALCSGLGEALDRSTRTGARLLDWPGDANAAAVQMRICGGLNALVRRGVVPELAALYPPNPTPAAEQLAAAAMRVIAAHDDFLHDWLDSPPQTNEVGRSGVIFPGLLAVAAATGLPLRLRELGASAGLNLRCDHYAYDLGGLAAGSDASKVWIAPKWDGAPPPAAAVRIVDRRGVDIAPLDVRDAATRERLLAFVWPDQIERVERLAAALDAAAADPPEVDREDAAAWTEAHVGVEAGAATVVFHSIAHQYFPEATKVRLATHMARAGAAATVDAPLAWLRFELDDPIALGPPPTLRLTLWPSGEERLLAHVHPHGSEVRWVG
jgi:hypothetical protein